MSPHSPMVRVYPLQPATRRGNTGGWNPVASFPVATPFGESRSTHCRSSARANVSGCRAGRPLSGSLWRPHRSRAALPCPPPQKSREADDPRPEPRLAARRPVAYSAASAQERRDHRSSHAVQSLSLRKTHDVAYDSIGGHEHTRLRSPNALSTRPTYGQNFRSRVNGVG